MGGHRLSVMGTDSVQAAHGHSNSIDALCESTVEADRKKGDEAFRLFTKLVCLQLSVLTILIGVFCYVPSATEWIENEAATDSCIVATKIMTCLDWGLNAGIFCALFPLTILTIGSQSVLFRGTLWLVWSSALMLDLALFAAAYSWRKYAFAVCALPCGYALLLLLLDFLPKSLNLQTWDQCYNWAAKTGLVGGIVLILATDDNSYAWVGVVAPLVIVFVIYCTRLVLSSCPPEQAVLGSMFILFPEGLMVSLWALKRQANNTKDPDAALLGGSSAQGHEDTGIF